VPRHAARAREARRLRRGSSWRGRDSGGWRRRGRRSRVVREVPPAPMPNGSLLALAHIRDA